MRYTILIILALFGTLLSSLIPCNGQPVWYDPYLGLLFFLSLGISVFIWKFNKILSLLSLFCLISSFFIAQLSPRAIVLLFQVNLSLLACYGISKLDSKNRKIIVWGIFELVTLQLAWVTLQYFNLDPIFKSIINPGHSELVGFNGAKDQMGSFFAITFPVVLYCCPILAPLPIIAIILSKSSFAFISAIIAGLIYLSYTNRAYYKIFIVFVLLSSMIFFGKAEKIKSADIFTRANVWRYAAIATVEGKIDLENNGQKLQLKTNPIWGYGLGNFLRIFPFVPQTQNGVGNGFNFVNEKFEHAHNDYVEIFFEFGYLGLALISLFFLSFIWSFNKLNKSNEIALYFSCLIAYFLNASGNFLTHLGMSGLLLIIFYGMYRGSLNER